MDVANQFDINSSSGNPDQLSSRTLLFGSNISESNKSAYGNVRGSVTAHEVVYIILTTVLVPAIIITNILVAAAVGKFKRLQTPTNFYIVSLAFADIFIAIVLPFFTAVEIIAEDIVDTLKCIAPNRMLMMASGVSILTMTLIAFDRYMALANPFRYADLMTKTRIALLIAFSWLYSATVIWAPIIAGWYDEINIPERYCTFEIMHQKEHLLFVSALFAPSCLVISVCYIRIYMIARHHARAIAALESSVHFNLQTQFIAKDSKYAKTLAAVIGAFLVLWTPFQICLLYEVVTFNIMEIWIRNYCAFLAFANSALNPWIYAYKSADIRLAFKRISRSLSAALHHGPLREDERRISVVSNLYSALGRDIHLSRTDSRFGVYDDPACTTINVDIEYDAGFVNPAMDSLRTQSLPIESSGSCSCKKQRLPNSITGLYDEKVKHSLSCSYYHTQSLDTRNRRESQSNKIVSFLDFLTMDEELPDQDCKPTVGRKLSPMCEKSQENSVSDKNVEISTSEHRWAAPRTTFVDVHATNKCGDVQAKLSVTSVKSSGSNTSTKRVLSFVDIVTLDNDINKCSSNSRTENTKDDIRKNLYSPAPQEKKNLYSPTPQENKNLYSPAPQDKFSEQRTSTIHPPPVSLRRSTIGHPSKEFPKQRSSCIVPSVTDPKILLSKTNSYPVIQPSFFNNPCRKDAIVPNYNLLSFLQFHPFEEEKHTGENLQSVNLPLADRKESIISVNVDFRPSQELILDTKTLTAQFLSDSNGNNELNFSIGPRNPNLNDGENLTRNRSCSSFASPYSGQHIPGLSRQHSQDQTIC